MFILTVYDDLDEDERRIIGLIYFSKMSQIIKYSNKKISYDDLKSKQKVYKTYKNLFKLERVNPLHTCKYFSNGFFDKTS